MVAVIHNYEQASGVTFPGPLTGTEDVSFGLNIDVILYASDGSIDTGTAGNGWVVNWGDGSADSSGTFTSANPRSIAGPPSNTYADPGVYEITVTITEAIALGGGVSEHTVSVTIS